MLSQNQQDKTSTSHCFSASRAPTPRADALSCVDPHPSTRARLQPVLEVNPVQVGRTLHREEALCCKECLLKASIAPPLDINHYPNQGALPWTVAPAAACLAESCTGRSLATQDLMDEALQVLPAGHKHDLYPVSVRVCAPLHISMSPDNSPLISPTALWWVNLSCLAFTQPLSLPLLKRTGGENEMRKLMGQDKDREIVNYQLPLQTKQT